MKKASGLLGALNVKIAQLLVMQRSPSAALRFHADQVSGEKLFDTFWVDFTEVYKVQDDTPPQCTMLLSIEIRDFKSWEK